MTDTRPEAQGPADSGSAPDAGKIAIRLEGLTKRFAGQREPAVDGLTMEIPQGEIVILVGPSGCGKTTTMKMINRIIEPTSGRIILDGEDVTKVNPDQLRRRIGYVIQQIGLFPHATIAENIGTVPRLLGWRKERIAERIDELLEMVGMDPGQYRDRYPKELSGGQRQRVGVARAMSADPDVMLMDEPFGAIDPITRERLQNEFLRLQEQIKKTIIFVTHDIDEAIKMGDRIAILQEQSHIAQFDTPERILVNPANDFVSDFIGRGASLKRLSLSRVRDIELQQMADGPGRSERRGDPWGARRQRQERRTPARRAAAPPALGQLRPPEPGGRRTPGRRDGSACRGGRPAATRPCSDTLNEMITARYSTAIVVDADRSYQGIVDIDTINETVRSLRRAERGRLRPEGDEEDD